MRPSPPGPWDSPSARASSSPRSCSIARWRALMLKPETKGEDPSGRYAYDGLERIFHEKARLGIMTSLVTHPDGLLFGELKELCALTDGNLSRHLQALHDAGYVEVWKG